MFDQLLGVTPPLEVVARLNQSCPVSRKGTLDKPEVIEPPRVKRAYRKRNPHNIEPRNHHDARPIESLLPHS